MSGPPSTTNESNVATAQQQAATQYGQLAQQSLGQMNTLTQPAINYYSGLVNAANSGNYGGLVQAAGPTLGTISQQGQAAQNNIISGTPAGQGRNEALALLPGQQANAVSSTLNQQYNAALGNLTQLGAAYGGLGTSLAGAQLSGLGGAATTYGNVANQQAQSKADTTNLLGSLAGAAGTAASGGAFGTLGGGGGGSSSALLPQPTVPALNYSNPYAGI